MRGKAGGQGAGERRQPAGMEGAIRMSGIIEEFHGKAPRMVTNLNCLHFSGRFRFKYDKNIK